MVGTTQSSNGNSIASALSHQTTLSTNGDAFLVKFNLSGIRQWGTYYGGTGQDLGYGSAIDALGNIYLVGSTRTTTGNAIATPSSYQPVHGGGFWENAFLAKFNPSGTRQWGTYYGGSGQDFGMACAIDGNGSVYIGGYGSSSTGTIIATTNGHQPTFGGNSDGFLVKFRDCSGFGSSVNSNTPLCQNSTLNFTTTVTSTLTLNYNWQGPNSYTANIQNPSIANAGTVNAGTYTLAVNDGQGCSETATVSVTVNLKPIVSVNSGSICSGNSFTINPRGART